MSRWQLDTDIYTRMKLDILGTAQPIYTGRWNGVFHNFEVRYTPEVVAQLDAVDRLRAENEQAQAIMNLHYDAICYGMGWVPQFGWDGKPLNDRSASQM